MWLTIKLNINFYYAVNNNNNMTMWLALKLYTNFYYTLNDNDTIQKHYLEIFWWLIVNDIFNQLRGRLSVSFTFYALSNFYVIE